MKKLIFFLLICIVSLSAQDWTHYTNNDDIRSLLSDEDHIYVGTSSGLVILDRHSDDFEFLNTLNSDLPCNMITSMVFFKDLLWVGTERGGLLSYDGSSWTLYTCDNSELPYDMVYSLATDGETLWIGMFASLASFDGSNWTVYLKTMTDLPGSAGALCADSSGVWVGTTRGLARFDGTNWTIYTADNSGLPDRSIRALAKQGSSLWIGTFRSGICSYNNSNFTVYDTTNSNLPDNFIRCLASYGDSLFIGTQYGGLALLENEHFSSWNSSNSDLPADIVQSILPEADGSVWAGTFLGLSCLQDSVWIQKSISSSGLPHNRVYAVKNLNGKIWLGTYNGLACYDDGNWIVYTAENSGLPCDQITCLAADGNFLIVGTKGGGLASFDGHNWVTYIQYSPDLPKMNCIFPYDNELWIGTGGGGLLRLNGTGLTQYTTENSGLNENFVTSIVRYQNKFWIGCELGGGLCSYDLNQWQSHDISSVFDMPHHGGEILSLGVYNNLLWAGTREGGVAVYNGTTVSVFSHSNSDLPGGQVNIILPYGNKVWIGALGGLASYDGSTWDVFNGTNSSMTSSWIMDLAVSDGTLWIGTTDGAVEYRGSLSISQLPEEFTLLQNYPNPFNPVTTISYHVKTAGTIRLDIYDLSGHLLENRVNSHHDAGSYTKSWDGSKFGSGIYIYRLQAGDEIISRKMVLVK